MTGFPEIWNALAEEFRPELVYDRLAGGSRRVRYITARTAMNRLDQVLGFENWQDAYERDPKGGDNIVCRITIRLPDGSAVSKCDAGSPGSTGDEGDDDKGAFSDAFKRAAVKFGIGRYLYGDGVYRCPASAVEVAATPDVVAAEIPRPLPAPHPPRKPADAAGPRTGSALYRWAKDQEEVYGIGLIKYLDGWGKLQEFPRLMKEWDAEQVERAHSEAVRKRRSMAPAEGVAS